MPRLPFFGIIDAETRRLDAFALAARAAARPAEGATIVEDITARQASRGVDPQRLSASIKRTREVLKVHEHLFFAHIKRSAE